jgi:hypothetical protein
MALTAFLPDAYGTDSASTNNTSESSDPISAAAASSTSTNHTGHYGNSSSGLAAIINTSHIFNALKQSGFDLNIQECICFTLVRMTVLWLKVDMI